MKLVEVVIITGVQCISPVENTPVQTEASKVWCAVVVEKDTATDRVEVTPASEAANPAVRLVLQRFNAEPATVQKPAVQTIVPTSAPPDEERQAMPVPEAPSPDERVEPAARIEVSPPLSPPVPVDEAVTDSEVPATEVAAVTDTEAPQSEEASAAEAEAPQPETVAALEQPPEEEPKVVKAKAKKKKTASSARKKRSDVCGSGRKAVWYTNIEGRRKYRCRPAGSAVNLY